MNGAYNQEKALSLGGMAFSVIINIRVYLRLKL